MVYLRPWGRATTIDGVVLQRRGYSDFLNAPLVAVGDIMISKDNSTFVNIGTLPINVPVGSASLSFSFTDDDLKVKKIQVRIIDQTNPKAFEDWQFVIETYNHPNAEHPNIMI